MAMANQEDSMNPPLPGPRYFNPFAFIRSLSDPTDLMLRTRERYGDTYRLPTVLGPVVVTGDPEGVRAIFSADADTFVPYQPDLTAPILGEISTTPRRTGRRCERLSSDSWVPSARSSSSSGGCGGTSSAGARGRASRRPASCALRNEDRAGHDPALSSTPAGQLLAGIAGTAGSDNGASGRDPDDRRGRPGAIADSVVAV